MNDMNIFILLLYRINGYLHDSNINNKIYLASNIYLIKISIFCLKHYLSIQ